jgi:hypothetical protein
MLSIPLALLVLFLSEIRVGCSSRLKANEENDQNRQLYKFFTGGLNQLLWDDVFLASPNTSFIGTAQISQPCRQSLLVLKESFERGEVSAYKFVDSSARATPAILEGTTTSFGDFDQCLDISFEGKEAFYGQYCLVKFEVDRQKSSKLPISSTVKSVFPIANFYNPLHGLCVPSKCSLQDLKEILGSHICPKNGLTFMEIFSCDTTFSLSFSWFKLSVHQKISLGFILLFTGLCVVGTLCQAFGVNLFRKHSMINNIQELLEPPALGSRIEVADFFKMGFAMYGVAIHSIVAVVTPIGVYVVTRLTGIAGAVKTIWLQPLVNVHGLNIVPFLQGLAMGFSIYPSLVKRKVNSSTLIKERWLRNAPGMLCLLALEFLWPIAGSGPLYTFVANDILDDCHENWYRNVFFFTNYNPVMKNCMNHTFWSSIDFQLFILGVFILFVLARSKGFGITLLVVTGLADFIITGIIAKVYDTAHAMAAHPISVEKVIEYVDYIHNQTTNYMFTFVIGLSVGVYVVTGRNKHSFGFGVLILAFILMNISAYATVVFNNFSEYVDRKYIPVFLAIVKITIASGAALGMLFFTATPPSDKKKNQESKKIPEGKKVETSQQVTLSQIPSTDYGYRLFLMLSRLSTSLYLVNYWYIRYDFFTARAPFETSVMSFFKRFGYSVCFSEILAFFFYTILLAPMDAYRKVLFSSKVKVD